MSKKKRNTKHSDIKAQTMSKTSDNSSEETSGETQEEIVSKFPWGPVVNTHVVGDYLIVEYHPEIFEKSLGTGRYARNISMFHPYTRGKDTFMSLSSLDRALVAAIGQKHDGCNSSAAEYFFKMAEC